MMTKFFETLSPTTQKILPYLVLVLAVFGIYSNVYSYEFLFDDDLLIALNQNLQSWSHIGDILTGSTTSGAHIAGGFYRPMQILLYFFVYQMTEQSTYTFHLLNILLHAGNTCLMYALGRRLNFNPGAVFLATLLWAVHPIQTEAVTYMSGTADPLYAFFCLSGLVFLLPDFTTRRIFLSLPIMALGLLSKETAVIFPMLVVCCMYLINPDRLNLKTYLRTWPLWMLTGIYMAWRLTNTSFDGPAAYARLYNQHDFANMKVYAEHFSYRLFTLFATLPNYLTLLVWPIGLHMERSFIIFSRLINFDVLSGLFLCLAAAFQILWGHARRGLALSWGLLWFAISHSPNSGLLMPTNSLFLEHWMYVPTVGLFLGTAEAFSSILHTERARKVTVALITCVTLAMMVRTFDQNTVWESPISFYANIFRYGEVTARSHNNLALAYSKRGEYAKALDEFQKAIAITDTYAETRHNIAVTLLGMPNQKEHIDAVIANLKRALEIDPRFYRSAFMLSEIYQHQGDTELAARYREQAETVFNHP